MRQYSIVLDFFLPFFFFKITIAVCMCTTCMTDDLGGQKWELYPLDPETQIVVSYHVVLEEEPRSP